MAISNILILSKPEEYSADVLQLLESFEIKFVVSSVPEEASKLLFDLRPELILVDSDISPNPTYWFNEIDRLNLNSQLAAICHELDFKQAMAWIDDGVLSVLLKPIDALQLKKLLISAKLNLETLNSVSRQQNYLKSLSEFYRSLCGHLDFSELKKHLIKSLEEISGARKVVLHLRESFSHFSIKQGSYASINIYSENLIKTDSIDLITEGECAGKTFNFAYQLLYDLSVNEQDIGEVCFYFNKKSDLKILAKKDLKEILKAASKALNGAAAYNNTVKMAAHDNLTGLYNRRIFDEVLKREFAKAKRHSYPLTLLILDLDRFKKVNDSYGHQAGDEVLKAVAQILKKVARNTDIPTRVGGEEFAIILPHTTQAQAMVLAKRLKNKLSQITFEVGGSIFKQTISQGISDLEHFLVKSPEDMLYWADQSLYLAKNEGRDTIRMATDLPMTPFMKDGTYAFQ